jgi:hypothetical protein
MVDKLVDIVKRSKEGDESQFFWRKNKGEK